MPTFNQLVRKGRQTSVKKSTAPALQRTFNSLRKKAVEQSANLTQLLERSPEFVFPTVSK